MAGMRSMFELRGRSYIVTGGAMGIGYAITKAICEMGGNVAVMDLRETPLEPVMELAEEHGVQTHYVQADVSDEKSLRAGFEKVVSALGGKLDGIVTAAGIALDKPCVSQSWEEVNKVVQVNVSSVVEDRRPVLTVSTESWVVLLGADGGQADAAARDQGQRRDDCLHHLALQSSRLQDGWLCKWTLSVPAALLSD